MQRLLYIVAAVLGAALLVVAPASSRMRDGVLVVQNFKVTPPLLNPDGVGLTAWNLWPGANGLPPMIDGCISNTEGRNGEIDVTGQITSFDPSLTYTLEQRVAGQTTWQTAYSIGAYGHRGLASLTPDESGDFKVVWWQGDRQCPRVNISFRVASTGNDGSRYVSRSTSLGVQPKINATYRTSHPSENLWVTRVRVTAPGDVKSIRVLIAHQSGNSTIADPHSAWRLLWAGKRKGGVFFFSARSHRGGYYFLRVLTPATPIHAKSHLFITL